MSSIEADREAVLRSARELDEARLRLAEVLQAYRTTERSKFARLRTTLRTLLGVAGSSQSPPAALLATPLPPTRSAGLGQASDVTTAAVAAPRTTFELWQEKHELRASDIERMRRTSGAFGYRPTISILVATYNTPERYLREAIESVLAQAYPKWELCIADDASTDDRVRTIIDEYAARDERIVVVKRPKNGHISLASNSALAIATGDFVGFLDHDDLLTPDALFEVVLVLNEHLDADMIYSDEDKIDDAGTLAEPHFKPEWCPDSFLSRMYTCHFGVYRRSIARAIGGLRQGFEGSQDHDFVLRLTEQTANIHHIPRILYHWRIHSASTSAASEAKPYAAVAGQRAVQEAIDRRGEPGVVLRSEIPGVYITRYQIREPELVSVIVPTRDHGEDVDRCLTSIFANDVYPNFELVIVDNGSRDRESLATFERWKARDSRVRVLSYDRPFNFSAINNFAVENTAGKYLLFLNNDTEVIASDWMKAMVEQAQRPSIGVVGALLYYPDDTVQHAGVVIGLGGVAGHGLSGRPRSDPGYFANIRAINNYSALTAACIMVRRSVFTEVGGFDEGLAVAFNDVDFCLKVVAAGYRNIFLPHATLYHYESKSRGNDTSPEKEARFLSEIATMERRWATRSAADPCYSPNLSLVAPGYSIRL